MLEGGPHLQQVSDHERQQHLVAEHQTRQEQAGRAADEGDGGEQAARAQPRRQDDEQLREQHRQRQHQAAEKRYAEVQDEGIGQAGVHQPGILPAGDEGVGERPRQEGVDRARAVPAQRRAEGQRDEGPDGMLAGALDPLQEGGQGGAVGRGARGRGVGHGSRGLREDRHGFY